MTNPEQTVCDMIRYRRHAFHLYETIDASTWNGVVNTDRLDKLLKVYGLTNLYEDLVTAADNIYNEDA